jgi:hypothetical protein
LHGGADYIPISGRTNQEIKNAMAAAWHGCDLAGFYMFFDMGTSASIASP